MLGKFVWHDLMATDVAASKRFYSELFGWRIWQGEHGGYEHVSLGEREIGGIVAPDPGRPLPAHWIGYVAVEDAAQTAARAKEAGGVVHLPPTEIPKIGRFTILGDPRGAAIAAFQATEWKPKDAAQPPPGEFCWDELLTDEPHAVVGFYRALFGWTDEPMEMPGFGTYHLFKRDGASVAGMMKSPPGAPHPPMWLSYVAVADADQSVARATRLGGQVLAEAREVPTVGRFAVLADPTRAAIAILAPPK